MSRRQEVLIEELQKAVATLAEEFPRFQAQLRDMNERIATLERPTPRKSARKT